MAASDRLIVTYTGNDERTNAVRPPAVPVGELLDTIDRTVRLDAATRAARACRRAAPPAAAVRPATTSPARARRGASTA